VRHAALYEGRTLNEVAEHLGADPGLAARTYARVMRDAGAGTTIGEDPTRLPPPAVDPW
jgi:hypothetical protein